MTTNQIISEISKKLFPGNEAILKVPGATYAAGAMCVRVTVVDTRKAFGRTDVQVVPVAGDGAMWVSIDTLVTPKKEASRP